MYNEILFFHPKFITMSDNNVKGKQVMKDEDGRHNSLIYLKFKFKVLSKKKNKFTIY